jgi:hypothetical protein
MPYLLIPLLQITCIIHALRAFAGMTPPSETAHRFVRSRPK